MISVLHVPAFQDNYIWLIRDEASGRAAIVDPGDAAPVVRALEQQGLRAAAILCTHHHGDHTGGNHELAARYGIPVYGPAGERIPSRTHGLRDGERLALDGIDLELEVLEVPGHTAGHIAYYGAGMLFCGDTLFSAGCGRLFEGTARQMYSSLARLAALPGQTAVYCAHEYTEANLRFAAAVEPDNPDLARRREEVEELRGQGAPSLPSTIAIERKTNPFLRAEVPAVRAAAQRYARRPLGSNVDVFAAIRGWKDGFRT